MAGRPTKLTPRRARLLVEAIREGAFDWVAAEAAGIARRTFYEWLEKGEAGQEPFARLAADVRQARAEARIGAERSVYKQRPATWLTKGPGRERPGAPGWTAPYPGARALAEAGQEVERVLEGALGEVEHPNDPARPSGSG